MKGIWTALFRNGQVPQQRLRQQLEWEKFRERARPESVHTLGDKIVITGAADEDGMARLMRFILAQR